MEVGHLRVHDVDRRLHGRAALDLKRRGTRGHVAAERSDEDDELIKVDLDKVPDHITRIVFSVVIWRAEERRQRFGSVRNAFIRIFDEETREEIVRFDLGTEFSDETLVMFGELYRRGTEWKFRAVGQGYAAAEYRRALGIQRAFETDYARYRN